MYMAIIGVQLHGGEDVPHRTTDVLKNRGIFMEDDKKQKLLLEKHKDIARIDQESKRTHGWYVRVRFLRQNPLQVLFR